MTFLRALVMLLRLAGFRRLLLARVTSQGSDGVFQVALASHVLFNPERNTDPTTIAAAFAVVLLPYSFLGPFAGTLLDRWPRRRVIVAGQLVRAGVVLAVAGLMGLGSTGVGFFLVVLLVFSVNRFVLAGFSAGLPHVIAREHLVSGNAVAPTTGSVAYFLGGVLGGLIGALSSALSSDVVVVVAAAAGILVAAGSAARLPFLGPDTASRDLRAAAVLGDIGRGLAEAARTLPRRARLLLGLVFVSRLPFGFVLLQTLLLFRGPFAQPDQQAGNAVGFGLAAGAAAAGFGLAAVITPWLAPRWHPVPFSARMLALSAVALLGLAPWLNPWVVSSVNFVVSFAAQTVKISIDSLLQTHVPDPLLGRTFALHDMMYNSGLVAAASLAAWTLPRSGAVTWPFLAAAGLLAVIAAGLPAAWGAASRADGRAVGAAEDVIGPGSGPGAAH